MTDAEKIEQLKAEVEYWKGAAKEHSENHTYAVDAFHDATRLRSEIQKFRIKAEDERDAALQKNKELRELLGNTRAFLAIHVWDNERSCCFYCGEKDYSVTADDCKEAPDYELAKKIDEVLNDQNQQ